ncbi:ribonuclease R [Chromatiales bacterium (ex Bugula neritina AB1)]|nr:ribonuclease R [Chromatiales bacterium (ex Bugula neritina AB1)]
MAKQKKKPSSSKRSKSRDISQPAEYQFEIASRETLLAELTEAGRPLTHEQVADLLSMHQRDEKYDALGKRLGAMVRDGQIVRNRRGAFIPVDEEKLVRGRVSAHPDGFGFLINEYGSDDIYLGARQMRTVMDGDRIVVHITGSDRRGRLEGAVVEVLERANKTLVGRLEISQGVAVLHPDNKRISREIIISGAGEAEDGQIVLVEIIEQPTYRRPPIATVVEVLGEQMAPGMEIDIAIRSRDIPQEWPQQVLAERTFFGTSVDPDAVAARRDLRSTPLLTIDGEDARDFDDAVFAEPKPYGWRLLVAIADVSHYVSPGSALDDEALNRGTSVYFPQRVIPMLPEVLSNGLCSLNPEVDRLCMVCDMGISHEGEIKRARFYPATMRSHARLTYTQVHAFLQGDSAAADTVGALGGSLHDLHDMYTAMREARAGRGAIEFESTETRIVFDDQAKIKQLLPVERNEAHMLIEECMIAANISAARFIGKRKIPGLYRIHEGPGADKLIDVRKFLAQRSLTLAGGDNPRASDYAQTLKDAAGRADLLVIQTVLLRSMNQAVYTTRNSGHFGLALQEYAHFTSPIRRYPDLMVHRAIKHVLAAKSADGFHYSANRVAEIGDHCSVTERRAEAAVRDVVAWLKCEFMQDQIGSSHAGVVTAVTSFGLFVELDGIHVEGLLHITSLPQDYYDFDPVNHRLTGRAGGEWFELGQPVEVIVAAVNLDERKIDFQLNTGTKRISRKGGVKRGKGNSTTAPRKGKPAKRKGKADSAEVADRTDERGESPWDEARAADDRKRSGKKSKKKVRAKLSAKRKKKARVAVAAKKKKGAVKKVRRKKS